MDTDKDKLTQAADYFKKAGVYGTRISVKHLSSPDSLPFTKYFANLIVSERIISDTKYLGNLIASNRIGSGKLGAGYSIIS